MLSGWKVSSFRANDSELAPQFNGLTGAHIPNGFYRYELTGPGTRPGWIPTLGGRVSVSGMEKFLVLTATREVRDGFSTDRALPSSFVIRGKIEPMPPTDQNSDPVRIHIHHIVGPWSNLDVKVDPDGAFRIYEPLAGPYLLTVIRGTEVLHVEPVLFAQDYISTSFAIKIGDKTPTVTRVH